MRRGRNSTKTCDTGNPPAQLASDFRRLDFSSLDLVYPDKASPAGAAYRYKKSAVLARGQAALVNLYQRTRDVVVVVSHSGFLRTAIAAWFFANADYLVFDLGSREAMGEGEPYRLVEWGGDEWERWVGEEYGAYF